MALRLVKVSEDQPMPEQATQSQPDGGGMHILCIDDDEALIFLLTRLLNRLGHKVTGFFDCFEAVEALKENPTGFDVVVTDYNMPGMSGLEVIRQVRNISPTLPVILATGFVTDEFRARVHLAGVTHMIFKPNAVEDYVQAIEQQLRSLGK
jgi:CheY-like chemotaxis protein